MNNASVIPVGFAVPYSVALATQNSALAAIVEKMWTQRSHNPYWKKLHEHIDSRTVDNWCDDHDQILKALIRKDPHAAKLAMWQHLENTKIMLFNNRRQLRVQCRPLSIRRKPGGASRYSHQRQ